MKINKYPDGTSYISLDTEIGSNHIETTFRINSYEDLWHLNQFCEALTYNGIKATIKIPNLLDAQADRRFGENQNSSLYLISELLNEYDNIHFEIFHPHNPEVVEAYFDRVTIKSNKDFIREVLNKTHTSDNPEHYHTILMSSDAGGFKPLMKLCDKLSWTGETTSASKSRQYVNGESKLIQILPSFNLDKDILIIDDICVYGGTFKGLSKAIKSVGHKGKLYLAVSHMTIQNLGDDPVTNYFDKVFTTNSKYDEYEVPESEHWDMEQPKNLEVIKMF